MKLIDKDTVLAEIKKAIKNIYAGREYVGIPYDEECIVRGLIEAEDIINSLKVKEVDLNEEIESYFKGFGKFPSVGIDDCIDIAKHFFDLGMRVSNPITAADRGMAEEIIINLKRVESDYRINLTKEIEWVRNQVKKGE